LGALRPRVALALLVLFGCSDTPPSRLPTANAPTVIGPEDLFDVTVLGEKDLSHEFQVQPDGTIDFPYVHGVKVAGMEPQEVAELLKRRLVEGKILADPQVSLVVKQYNSRTVLVTGSVQAPKAVTWAPGMTVVGAISQCGWFTPLADKGHVMIIRRAGKDKSVKAVVSVEAITRHTQEDVPLQPGDTINVTQNVF
jgi:protein involved in polysaccharide export with SLBB domain